MTRSGWMLATCANARWRHTPQSGSTLPLRVVGDVRDGAARLGHRDELPALALGDGRRALNQWTACESPMSSTTLRPSAEPIPEGARGWVSSRLVESDTSGGRSRTGRWRRLEGWLESVRHGSVVLDQAVGDRRRGWCPRASRPVPSSSVSRSCGSVWKRCSPRAERPSPSSSSMLSRSPSLSESGLPGHPSATSATSKQVGELVVVAILGAVAVPVAVGVDRSVGSRPSRSRARPAGRRRRCRSSPPSNGWAPRTTGPPWMVGSATPRWSQPSTTDSVTAGDADMAESTLRRWRQRFRRRRAGRAARSPADVSGGGYHATGDGRARSPATTWRLPAATSVSRRLTLAIAGGRTDPRRPPRARRRARSDTR